MKLFMIKWLIVFSVISLIVGAGVVLYRMAEHFHFRPRDHIVEFISYIATALGPTGFTVLGVGIIIGIYSFIISLIWYTYADR